MVFHGTFIVFQQVLDTAWEFNGVSWGEFHGVLVLNGNLMVFHGNFMVF